MLLVIYYNEIQKKNVNKKSELEPNILLEFGFVFVIFVIFVILLLWFTFLDWGCCTVSSYKKLDSDEDEGCDIGDNCCMCSMIKINCKSKKLG